MHIDGFQCSTCVDAFIKVKAPVKINTLIQTEYEIYKKGQFCLSLVTSYGNPDINIVNCLFKFDGKSYTVSD